VAPYNEVIEVLESDGTVNDEARLLSSYDQLDQVVGQSSFPSPRGNIDEVDVDEDSIRAFVQFGGSLVELERDSAYHTSFNIATQPYVEGTIAGPYVGMDGAKLTFQVDSHSDLPIAAASAPAADDVTVTFADAAGAGLTIDDVVSQINAVVPDVASDNGSGLLRLTSTNWGAGASVVVRKSGAANVFLGISTTADQVASGGGFYVADDNDGDLNSPRVEVYQGTTQRDIGSADVAAIATPPDFVAEFVEAGDVIYANGVNIGAVEAVSTDRLLMEVEQNIPGHPAGWFAPRYLWVQAEGLSYPAPSASVQATLTGAAAAQAETVPFIVSGTIGYGVFPAFATQIDAGQSFTVGIVIDGVAAADETIVAAADWTTLAQAQAGINAAATNFEAYLCNSAGDEEALGRYLGLRLLATSTGSTSSITYVSGTAGMDTLNFTTGASDFGENERFVDLPAIITSLAPVPSTAGTETLTLAVKKAGSAMAESPEAMTFGANASLDAVVTDFNTSVVLVEAYKSDINGVEDAGGTYLSIRTRGENLGSGATIQVTVDGGGLFEAAPPGAEIPGTDQVDGAKFRWSLDNSPQVYEAIFVADEDDNGLSMAQVIEKINELTPGVASESADSPPKLVMTSNKEGEGSEVEIFGVTAGGTANVFLQFGSDPWTADTTDVGSGRPNPDLAIDVSGDAVLQGHILRDALTGYPYANTVAPLYMAYTGLRLDMSPDAQNPGLITWDDPSTVEEVAPPISPDNPGSLMSYLALLNAPRTVVASIGVPEVSADAPEGTPAGYTSALSFLETEEVYGIAVGSQSAVVHQAALAHVDAMSQAENKAERILLFNPVQPDRENPTTVGSGTDANSTGVSNQVELEVNIGPALIALGINPNEDINPLTGEIENEVYLDLGSDDKVYLVQAVTDGTKVTCRTSFASGDGNDDSFYSTDTLPASIISDDWAVYQRGATLTLPGSTLPDKNGIASTVSGLAEGYGNRRGYMVYPDTCKINVSGLEQQVPGYYAAAAVAGMTGGLKPQQGFTNYPIAGLTGVVGSNDMFTESQLNTMAYGGVYILVQDVEGGPVSCRHQLSTDNTSVETLELSITKVVDYTAKFIRGGLRQFIGRTNITQAFMDQLGTIIQGLISFLTETGVLNGAEVNNIIQSDTDRTTILVDITLDVPYPCNYIRVTLIV
jgi:hypothetical protein